MATYRLDIAYDGSGFRGFARQPEQKTVQGEIEAALARLIGPTETVGAGRTDSGVHARGQVLSFRADPIPNPGRLLRSINGLVAPEIAAIDLREVDDDFDARFSAAWRSYRYFVLDRPVPDPILRNRVWHVPRQLDLEKMNEATEPIIGEHDFAAFCRAAEGRGTVRTVLDARWERFEETAVFEIKAGAFCHQMVRSLVAFMVDIGRGKTKVSAMTEVLASKDRAGTAGVAPPHGLVLWQVGY